MGQLTNLAHFGLYGNQLTGPIPVELAQLTNLIYLGLNGNLLTGTIPSELGQLTNLTYLGLSENQLAEPIPPELGKLTNLTVLRLDGNRLTGPIPPELGKLIRLTGLGLIRNRLTGQLPRELRKLLRLEFLALDPSIDGLSARQRRLVARSTARLNDERDDEIAAMIAAGESKTVEFKETLRVNTRTGERDKRMEHAVLKNIAAFLNTDGGTLIIGVKDKGEPLGLDRDGFPNEDRMGLYLRDIVNGQIGAGAWGNIEPEFASYQGKRILVIRCTKSKTPIYVGKDDEFYIRTGPGATPLRPREITPYINSHFSDAAPPVEDDTTDIA